MPKLTAQSEKTSNTQTGQDIIYICQHCGNREKEFALSSRNYKYCGKCGYTSVKSSLVDSYNFVTNLRFTPTFKDTDEFEEDSF